MSTVEQDLADYQSRVDRDAASEIALEHERDDARDILNDGSDYSTQCSQQAVIELLCEDDEVWRLIQIMWSTPSEFDLQSAARELRSHCSACIDTFIAQNVELPRRAA